MTDADKAGAPKIEEEPPSKNKPEDSIQNLKGNSDSYGSVGICGAGRGIFFRWQRGCHKIPSVFYSDGSKLLYIK